MLVPEGKHHSTQSGRPSGKFAPPKRAPPNKKTKTPLLANNAQAPLQLELCLLRYGQQQETINIGNNIDPTCLATPIS